LDERQGDPPLRVAVDCPSGLDCDSGALDANALRADLTVTFAAAKRGQLAFPGAEAVGELVVADIGLAGLNLPALDAVPLTLATEDLVRGLLPARPRNAHKGTFGRVLVVAGSVNYTGAAYLAASAAYRVGAGLVTLAVVLPVYGVLAGQLPEATWIMLPQEQGVIARAAADLLRGNYARTQGLLVGPGLGTEPETAQFVRRWLGAEEVAGQRHGQFGFVSAPAAPGASANDLSPMPPTVVDADGLRLMARIEGWAGLLPHEAVLTPHPGEMAALTGLDKDVIEADRIGTAQKFAAQWGRVVVLKGAFTIVAAPDGRTVVQPFATAALARAGTGDVLAGTIVSLMAQGLSAFDAAVAGAFLHGQAGLLAAQALGTTASVLATDIIEGLIEALAAFER
jgi:NAD(P)H-hydrate epimerase